jgi:hypothetical protein
MRDMGLVEQLAKKIEAKERDIRQWRDEVAAIEGKIHEAEVYIRAVQDMQKLLPRETTNGHSVTPASMGPRPGSDVAKAMEVIRGLGHPVHIGDLLTLINKENTLENRRGLSGSLAAYVREGRVFVRTAPNTFGLYELGHKNAAEVGIE